jgi:hypothetical protein
MQGNIPDHAVANFAVRKGLFENNGICAENLADIDAGLSYPQSYWEYIGKRLTAGEYVLAVSSSYEFEGANLCRYGSVFSHGYSGYALITRANTMLPAVDNTAPTNRMLSFKMLLETMEYKQMWAVQNAYNRFSWQTSYDWKFIDLLRGLSDEIMKGEKYQPISSKQTHSKGELESLYDIGKDGSDCVVTHTGNLARAYANPGDYRVLLSYETIIKILKGLSDQHLPPWASHLKSLYHADKKAVAMERFKTFWLNAFSQLEAPVYWQLFAPPNHDPKEASTLLGQIELVKQDSHKALWHPAHRDDSLQCVMNMLNDTYGDLYKLTDFESFKLAWEKGYTEL